MLGAKCNQWAGYECTNCKINLRHISKNGIRMNNCMSCIVEKGRRWQLDNHKYFLEYQKAYRKRYAIEHKDKLVAKYQRENKARGEKRAERRAIRESQTAIS